MVGSLINRVSENGGNLDKPAVGMGGTAFYYTDRSIFTVTEIVDEKTILAKGDEPVFGPNGHLSGYPDSYKEAVGHEFKIVLTPTGWRTATYTRTGRLAKGKNAGTLDWATEIITETPTSKGVSVDKVLNLV